MYSSKIIAQNVKKLKEFPPGALPKAFTHIYDEHHGRPVIYILCTEAQVYYDDLADSYAERFNLQYDTDTGNILTNYLKKKVFVIQIKRIY